jgi:iron-sulfur cluster repair protein YtfE (RIC family)
MLVSIDSRKPPEDLVGILSECHERIRRFTHLAEEIGRRPDVPVEEVVDGCRRVKRYFTEALPRHVEDEERSLGPRLRGHSPDVDAALEAMELQHREHEPLLRDLLERVHAVQIAPKDALARDRLGAAAAHLAAELERHLELEEQVLFPAIRAFSPAEEAAVREEMQARRR